MSIPAGIDDRISARLAEIGLGVELAASPNHDERGNGQKVDTVVIHYTCLDFVESIHHLSSLKTAVSTHYVIDRDGKLIQMVPVHRRAWHAGVTELDGRGDVNGRSVGVDLVFVPSKDKRYEEAQYRTLIALVEVLVSELPILPGHVVGHEHVARPVGRKQDPGPCFDWNRLYGALGVESPPPLIVSWPESTADLK